jgi:hypothetical protein
MLIKFDSVSSPNPHKRSTEALDVGVPSALQLPFERKPVGSVAFQPVARTITAYRHFAAAPKPKMLALFGVMPLYEHTGRLDNKKGQGDDAPLGTAPRGPCMRQCVTCRVGG